MRAIGGLTCCARGSSTAHVIARSRRAFETDGRANVRTLDFARAIDARRSRIVARARDTIPRSGDEKS